MGKVFKAMALNDIDEGRFVADINEEIDETAKAHIAHIARFGSQITGKTKSIVTVKLAIEFDGNADGIYTLKGEVSRKLPARPSSVTRAFHEQEQDGTDALFVRTSGGDASHPRQLKLATNDGRGVDMNTGEVKEPAPPTNGARRAPAPDRRTESAGK